VRVENVLDAERDAVQQTARGDAEPVELTGTSEHGLRIHVNPRLHAPIGDLDPLEARTRDRLDGRDAARKPVVQFRERR
jgi:hypothetical protein